MRLFEHADYEQAILQARNTSTAEGCALRSSRRTITLRRPCEWL